MCPVDKEIENPFDTCRMYPSFFIASVVFTCVLNENCVRILALHSFEQEKMSHNKSSPKSEVPKGVQTILFLWYIKLTDNSPILPVK